MERSEPNLIPQWLKGSGNVTGAGTTGHQTPLSLCLYDDHALSKHGRNRSSNVNCHDIGRSVGNRTTSTYFRRSSTNNGSGRLQTQSSFGRGDRECERVTFDFRRCDYSDPSENILQSRVDKDLRRSQSLITGKFNNNKSNQNNNNDLIVGNSLMSPNHKIAFERNFPSLGVDEKQTALELRRVSSLLLTPIILGGDRWTSALADVPIMFGSIGPGGVVEQPITSAVASMAETVAQGSSHANNISQLLVGNQRLEELVLKQSRQLIPIQTMSKSSVLNPSEKAKAKISHPQQNPSSLTNLSPQGGAGKLQVLKSSAREKNGGPLISPPTDDSVVLSSSSSSAVTPDRRQAPPYLEKRLTQARSRNDFFNLVRKNSMSSPSSSVVACCSSAVEQSDGDSVVDQSTMKANDDDGLCESDNNVKSNSVLYSEEKEAAFLRSLGWEENDNNGDDEGLTEEEINTFYKDMNEYMKLRPTLKSSQKLFGPGNLSSFHSSNGSATFSGSKASS